MDDQEFDQRLSRISTQWTMLRQAHDGSDKTAAAARQLLMQRYCGAIYRYLLSAVRDPHAAEDLTQEFALRFVRGRFRQADPTRGRFRDYVKTALFHLVDDYRKGQARRPQGQPLDESGTPAADTGGAEADEAFLNSWRDELLARTWKTLEVEQQQAGQPYSAALRLRVAQPDMSSSELAKELSSQLGRPFTATGLRQILHRARAKFAELLLQETEQSLGSDAQDQLEQELADLNLLKYCQSALERRDRKPK